MYWSCPNLKFETCPCDSPSSLAWFAEAFSCILLVSAGTCHLNAETASWTHGMVFSKWAFFSHCPRILFWSVWVLPAWVCLSITNWQSYSFNVLTLRLGLGEFATRLGDGNSFLTVSIVKSSLQTSSPRLQGRIQVTLSPRLELVFALSWQT